MDIKLIATDLDGTLLDKSRVIPKLNRDALLACEAKGIFTVLASGRCFESVALLAKEIGLTSPIISANGARVDASPDGPPIMMEYFDRALAERVFSILINSGIYFVCYGPGVMYQHNRKQGSDNTRGLNKESVRTCHTVKNDGDVLLVNETERTRMEGLDHIHKFVLFDEDTERLNEISKVLSSKTQCALSSSHYDNLEVMLPGAGKGRAIECLMKHYGIERDQIMAFGDHTNDLTMLQTAGYPVIMDNGLEEMKKMAWKIAPGNDEAGVGKILYEYVLGEQA